MSVEKEKGICMEALIQDSICHHAGELDRLTLPQVILSILTMSPETVVHLSSAWSQLLCVYLFSSVFEYRVLA